MRRLATPILLILLPLAVFLALFNVATLDIGNAGWLIRGTDNGENALGLHAYLHDPAAGTSLRSSSLNAPDGVPLLFTDSNPLVGLFAKPLAPLLPADAQFVGPWVLLSLLLSGVFAWLLLRRRAPGALALWSGVVLLAFPPTLANRFIHTNLMAHWTILAALWLFLDPVRGARLRWWAPLIAVTALIHSYLLVMVGAIWASAMLLRIVRGTWHEGVAAMGQAAVILLMVAVLALWLGVAGDYAPAGNYGYFAMPLDALWNPANPTYSNLLPAIHQREGRGFEGFQYLGLGGLLLVAAAALVALRTASPARERLVWRRLVWLLPALVVLTLLAVSHHPDFAGQALPRLELPERMVIVFDAIRASGRLFWPVGYVLVFAALLAVMRLSAERAGLLLFACLALQVGDLTNMARAIHANSAEARYHRRYNRTLDPRWDALIAAARDVTFIPGDVTKDLGLFQEVAWRALIAGRPVRTVYAARTSRATAARLVQEEAAFGRGELVPGRLYILLPTAPLTPAAVAHMVQLDGVVVVGPVSASSPRSASSRPGCDRVAGSGCRYPRRPRSDR